MSDILSSLAKTSGIAVFLRLDESDFELASEKPDWLCEMVEPHFDIGQSLNIESLLPSLTRFIGEANDFWNCGEEPEFRSDPWVELLHNGYDVPLEATAVNANQQAFLVIKDMGTNYYNQLSTMDSLHQKALIQEQLASEVERQTELIQSHEEQIALSLLNAADFRDSETSAHVRRIGLYAEVMAKALGWSDALASEIRIASPMHDIGKISTPDNVLLKPGKLTEDEFEIMKQHAVAGAHMLGDTNISMLQMAADIAHCHHEKWDGTGYPRGLKDKEIPEAARITTIVDVYDALSHKRVYKEAFSETETLNIMSDMVGSHFDPDLYQVFINNLPEMRKIAKTVVD